MKLIVGVLLGIIGAMVARALGIHEIGLHWALVCLPFWILGGVIAVIIK